MPPVPAFYHRPQTLDDVINQTVNRVLDQFDIDLPEDLFTRWQGLNLCTSRCMKRHVALFQGNYATAIISSTFNSFFPFSLRFVRQTCYLSPLRQYRNVLLTYLTSKF
jgi:4-hydroxy-3-polyprenylbenzoate decarboxylase